MALPDDDRRTRRRDAGVVLLLVEATALLIALVTPITPSKTGGPSWSPAELFDPDPSYGFAVLADFVMVNLLVAVLALAVWISVRARGGRRGGR